MSAWPPDATQEDLLWLAQRSAHDRRGKPPVRRSAPVETLAAIISEAKAKDPMLQEIGHADIDSQDMPELAESARMATTASLADERGVEQGRRGNRGGEVRGPRFTDPTRSGDSHRAEQVWPTQRSRSQGYAWLCAENFCVGRCACSTSGKRRIAYEDLRSGALRDN
jgi:hypothetical protein